MTAAHCCKAYSPVASNYKVRVGVHVWSATNEPYAKTYTLEKLIIHPSYQRPKPQSNDFCLLKINGVCEDPIVIIFSFITRIFQVIVW